MDYEPFAQLDLDEIEEAERRAHPILFRLAELYVLVRYPVEGWRSSRRRDGNA